MKVWQPVFAFVIALMAPTRSLQTGERMDGRGSACEQRIPFGERYRMARANLEHPGTWSLTR
jgi:hypothetical protein